MNTMRLAITRERNDDRRNDFGKLNARNPIRTLSEVAEITGLTWEQVRYTEENAFDKIRAALSAWGYHKERTR